MSSTTPQSHILILGSGIVGSALAHTLSLSPSLTTTTKITVLSPPLSQKSTSTSLAPGLVGQLNALPALTSLAKSSVSTYLTLSLPSGGFSQTGGLEIASTAEGIKTLEERAEQAREAGLEARLLSSEEVAGLAPQFHDVDGVSKGLYFPSDGVAEPERIVEAFQTSARSRGVEFLEGSAQSIVHSAGVVTGVQTPNGFIGASKVIVASGIWSASLLKGLLHLPVIPVAHPYIYGPSRPAREKKTPFIRWPEKMVYARDHGECEGFGTYDFPPIPVSAGEKGAEGEWEAGFDGAVERALGVLPEGLRRVVGEGAGEEGVRGSGGRRINGVFAVTPDGLPVVGPVEGVEGLWVAAAVWITHAAGVAGVVAKMVGGEEVEGEEEEMVRRAIDPGRFRGKDEGELRREAVGRYNDIYNMEE